MLVTSPALANPTVNEVRMSTVSNNMSVGKYRKAVCRPSGIKPLLAHALAVAVEKLAAASRDDLQPGAFEIAENVRIVGTLHVGNDGNVSGSFAVSNIGLVAPTHSTLPLGTRG